jgi:hypothetical protein
MLAFTSRSIENNVFEIKYSLFYLKIKKNLDILKLDNFNYFCFVPSNKLIFNYIVNNLDVFFIINMNIRVNLRAPRLISRALKLTTM